MEEKQMKKYEFTYWLNPEIAGQDPKNAIDEIIKSIEKMGGKIIDEREMMHERFAYPIKHFNEGFLKVSLISFPADKVEELFGSLKLNNNVLRYNLGRSESIREPIKKSETIKSATKPDDLPIRKTVSEKTATVEEDLFKNKPDSKEAVKTKQESPENISEKIKTEEKDSKITIEEVDKKLEEILGHKL